MSVHTFDVDIPFNSIGQHLCLLIENILNIPLRNISGHYSFIFLRMNRPSRPHTMNKYLWNEPESREAGECCTAGCSLGLPCLASCCWTWSESRWVLIFSPHSAAVAAVAAVDAVVVGIHAAAHAPQLEVADC